jgi:hypothetical protein
MKKRLGKWFIVPFLLGTLGAPNVQADVRRVDKHATGTTHDEIGGRHTYSRCPISLVAAFEPVARPRNASGHL